MDRPVVSCVGKNVLVNAGDEICMYFQWTSRFV